MYLTYLQDISQSKPVPRVFLPPEFKNLRTEADCRYLKETKSGSNISTRFRPIDEAPELTEAEISLTELLVSKYDPNNASTQSLLIEEVHMYCEQRRQYKGICGLLHEINTSGHSVQWTNQEACCDPETMFMFLRYRNFWPATSEAGAEAALGHFFQRLFRHHKFYLGR